MDRLRLFVGEALAGELSRNSDGTTFRYADDYSGPPVFLHWSEHHAARHWQALPSELACLLPEGAQRALWGESETIDRSDWSLLAATGSDLPGVISVLPDDLKRAPLGREAERAKPLNRARILPAIDALPYSEESLATYNSAIGFTTSLASRRACAGAIYSRKESVFKLVKGNGSYRLTLEPTESPGWVENQLLTARLAQDAGLSVAPIGRVQTTDGVPVLWAERFDRSGASNCQRSRLESACQLLGQDPGAKFEGSMESIAQLIRQYCTNPKVQLMRLFHRVLFGWLTGDSGLHLKKWSLLQNGLIVELSPAYGLMNHTIQGDTTIESALSVNDQREGLNRGCLLEYFGSEICGLNARMLERVMKQLGSVAWEQRILESGISKPSQRAYFELLSERWRRLNRL